MTINNLNSNKTIQENKWVITNEDRKQVESQKENLTKLQSEKGIQHGIQNSQVDFLKKKLILNDWVNPETSESRIYWPAQFVMEMLDNPDNYRTLAWLRFGDNYEFWLYAHWNDALPQGIFSKIITLQGKENAYKELLWLIQKETKNIFIENDKSNYTKSSEEFRITKIKKSMEELNQHKNDSEFNQKYNDWMYNILYLLHESFWETYLKKYWDYYESPERKEEVKKMQERSKNVKIS